VYQDIPTVWKPGVLVTIVVCPRLVEDSTQERTENLEFPLLFELLTVGGEKVIKAIGPDRHAEASPDCVTQVFLTKAWIVLIDHAPEDVDVEAV
jgi:hypothetical protein